MKAVMKATLILQLNDKLLQTVEGMLQRDIIYGSKFYGDQRKVNIIMSLLHYYRSLILDEESLMRRIFKSRHHSKVPFIEASVDFQPLI